MTLSQKHRRHIDSYLDVFFYDLPQTPLELAQTVTHFRKALEKSFSPPAPPEPEQKEAEEKLPEEVLVFEELIPFFKSPEKILRNTTELKLTTVGAIETLEYIFFYLISRLQFHLEQPGKDEFKLEEWLKTKSITTLELTGVWQPLEWLNRIGAQAVFQNLNWNLETTLTQFNQFKTKNPTIVFEVTPDTESEFGFDWQLPEINNRLYNAKIEERWLKLRNRQGVITSVSAYLCLHIDIDLQSEKPLKLSKPYFKPYPNVIIFGDEPEQQRIRDERNTALQSEIKSVAIQIAQEAAIPEIANHLRAKIDEKAKLAMSASASSVSASAPSAVSSSLRRAFNVKAPGMRLVTRPYYFNEILKGALTLSKLESLTPEQAENADNDALYLFVREGLIPLENVLDIEQGVKRLLETQYYLNYFLTHPEELPHIKNVSRGHAAFLRLPIITHLLATAALNLTSAVALPPESSLVFREMTYATYLKENPQEVRLLLQLTRSQQQLLLDPTIQELIALRYLTLTNALQLTPLQLTLLRHKSFNHLFLVNAKACELLIATDENKISKLLNPHLIQLIEKEIVTAEDALKLTDAQINYHCNFVTHQLLIAKKLTSTQVKHLSETTRHLIQSNIGVYFSLKNSSTNDLSPHYPALKAWAYVLSYKLLTIFYLCAFKMPYSDIDPLVGEINHISQTEHISADRLLNETLASLLNIIAESIKSNYRNLSEEAIPPFYRHILKKITDGLQDARISAETILDSTVELAQETLNQLKTHPRSSLQSRNNSALLTHSLYKMPEHFTSKSIESCCNSLVRVRIILSNIGHTPHPRPVNS